MGSIERFSEVIDLILDWNEVVDEDPYHDRSRAKQDRFNKDIVRRTRAYLKETLLPAVPRLTEGICESSIDERAPDTIVVRYPFAFKEPHLRPEVQLEAGTLAAWLPNDEYAITPYAAEAVPGVFSSPSVTVRAIRAERTFWEKATILHQEAHRPESKPQPIRHSRHYYDLAMMAGIAVRARALTDPDLLREVVGFKQRFYPCGWARYETACPGTFRLVPADAARRALASDYRQMSVMIFGDAPAFEAIMSGLRDLEEEINAAV